MGGLIGGLLLVLLVSILVERFFVKRLVDTAAAGKPLSVLIAWMLILLLTTFTMGMLEGFLSYTPGAIVLAIAGHVRGLKSDREAAERTDPLEDIFS